MRLGLGIDAGGGSQSRWALVGTDQVLVADGSIAGLSALQLASESGLRKVMGILSGLAIEVSSYGRVAAVHAGTGSIAGFVDRTAQFHRAGGRGGILDDGGSGYWITVEALR